MPIATLNPATGQIIKTFQPLSPAEIDNKLEQASNAFATYRHTPFAERSRKMEAAASILEQEAATLARIVTTEMGKPVGEAEAEIRKCASVCRYYAKNAESFLRDETIETDASLSYVRFQPLGPILAVMPWNFPFWQVFRFAAPALMAGNVALLKHASNVPQCALAIEDIFRRAGFAAEVFQTLLIPSSAVARLLETPHVAAATLTGSEPAGSALAAVAGREIKKCVLELGGSDPFIVMPSANLDDAVSTAVRARCLNSGQSCIAAKRFLVAEPIAAAFEERFVAKMQQLRVGDPFEASTDVGPLATRDLVDSLDRQVQQSVAAGARFLTGGTRLDGPGFYFAPTVLAGVTESAPAYSEELFGPVAVLFRVAGVEDAIRLANNTAFGLGASVWTTGNAEQARFIDGIEAGAVFVNGMVKSDPRLPFGGVKRSGFGRELASFGIREFVNIKTVHIA
jgi:succinate-semialdehyde dehydrogenase / glutarate-semialdehyde dehydrogenase